MAEDSENSVEIKFVTSSNNSGAQEAKAGIDEVKGSADEAGTGIEKLTGSAEGAGAALGKVKDPADEGGFAFGDLGKSAEKAGHHMGGIGRVARMLHHEFPLLGIALHAALHPVIAGFGLLLLAMHTAHDSWKAFADSLKQFDANKIGDLGEVTKASAAAMRDAQIASDSYWRSIKALEEKKEDLIQKTERYIGVLKKERAAQDLVESAEKGLAMAKIDQMESSGGLSAIDAAQQRATVSHDFEQRRREHESADARREAGVLADAMVPLTATEGHQAAAVKAKEDELQKQERSKAGMEAGMASLLKKHSAMKATKDKAVEEFEEFEGGNKASSLQALFAGATFGVAPGPRAVLEAKESDINSMTEALNLMAEQYNALFARANRLKATMAKTKDELSLVQEEHKKTVGEIGKMRERIPEAIGDGQRKTRTNKTIDTLENQTFDLKMDKAIDDGVKKGAPKGKGHTSADQNADHIAAALNNAANTIARLGEHVIAFDERVTAVEQKVDKRLT